jgi:CheY-like chemotaxis protein
MPFGPLVLIVDDSEDIRNVFSTFLEHEGFSVLAAADGTRGITLARKHRPKVIVMDGGLPGLSGWDALRQIKADPELSDIPTLFVTGDGRTDAAERAFAAGAAGFLLKPFPLDRLMRLIRHTLEIA